MEHASIGGGMGLAILGAVLLSGCTTPSLNPKSVTPDRAFIQYDPTAAEPGKLRLAVKDFMDVKGTITTAGSAYLAKRSEPAADDAACLAHVRREGIGIAGKTNLTEFAIGVSGINDYFGTPKNPLTRKRRVPGGSSSGSAVAVANGRADVALGTDTAGSIRVPAACCGVYGLKTTYGLIPLEGVFPISPEYLDTVGTMAANLENLVAGMDLLEPGFAAQYRRAQSEKPVARQIRIGRLYVKNTKPRVDQAVDAALGTQPFQVVVLDDEFLAAWEQAQRDAQTVAAAGAWLHYRSFTDKLGVSPRTKAIIAVGAAEYRTNYEEALGRIAGWQRTLRDVFREVDVIALPTLKGLPPRLPFFVRLATMEARVLRMQNTAAVNLAGNPALAMPVPLDHKRVPATSLQLIGRKFAEEELVNVARLIERGLRTRSAEVYEGSM